MSLQLKWLQKLTIDGRENLPQAAPFMLVANHCSHLDALVMATVLPSHLRSSAFPVAAGDTFFDTPIKAALSAGFINALPIWRRNGGRHAVDELRSRLTTESCGSILFPEGTRSRTGEMSALKPGLGLLVAGTPVPVYPCICRAHSKHGRRRRRGRRWGRRSGCGSARRCDLTALKLTARDGACCGRGGTRGA